MKLVSELRRNFEEAIQLKSDDKLIDMRKIRKSIEEIELSAMRDPNVSLKEITDSRILLGQVDCSIMRLEAGQRRRQKNSDDRNGF